MSSASSGFPHTFLAKAKALAVKDSSACSSRAASPAFSYSRIVSPMNGVVTAKSVDAGTLVMPRTPLLTVEDPTHYRLETSLPEEFLDQARVGQAVMVKLNQAELPGRVAEVVPAADPSSRTFLIKIELPSGCRCSSGEYGKAEFRRGEENRLTVPRSALVERGELEGVDVIGPGNAAEFRLVKTGETFGDRVEILSSLADGERIATSETARLKDASRLEAQ